MKILWAYRGRCAPEARLPDASTLLDVPAALPVTHMSSVNDLLLMHWLGELGHEVHVLVDHEPRDWYLPQVSLKDADPADFDLLFFFKYHAIRDLIHKRDLLKRPWRKVGAWMDFSGTARVLGGDALAVDMVCWGTPGLEGQEAPLMPHARHCVVGHATTFVERPPLGANLKRGLYAGRLPGVYRQQVEMAGITSKMLVCALKLELDGGDWVYLRPGQYEAADLKRAKEWAAGFGLDLEPALNMHTDPEVRRACFGLVPATKPPSVSQVHSACKAWDYWALGLPVVVAHNTPESAYVYEKDALGYPYISGDLASMDQAIGHAVDAVDKPGFTDLRRAIQDWTFSNHTWRHRAQEIHEFISG